MTKKIIWRLKESPTTEKLSQLVKDSILTKDEAREILFNLTDESERSIESYQQEIKFLREIIDKLSSREKIVEIVKEYHHYDYPWYQPYWIWTSCNDSRQSSTDTLTIGTYSGSTALSQNFSDITTF